MLQKILSIHENSQNFVRKMFFTKLKSLLISLLILTTHDCRVIEGLGQGVTMPAMYTFLSKWSPPQERSMLVAFVLAGKNKSVHTGYSRYLALGLQM